MPDVDPKILNELITKAGLSPSAAAKLRAANAESDQEGGKKRPAGHGAAQPNQIQVGDL